MTNPHPFSLSPDEMRAAEERAYQKERRTRFAIAALPGCMAYEPQVIAGAGAKMSIEPIEVIAKMAFEIADAMIAEADKPVAK